MNHSKSFFNALEGEVSNDEVPTDDADATALERVSKVERSKSERMISWSNRSERNLRRAAFDIGNKVNNDKGRKVQRSLSSRPVRSDHFPHHHEERNKIYTGSQENENDFQQLFRVRQKSKKQTFRMEKLMSKRLSDWKNSSLRSLDLESELSSEPPPTREQSAEEKVKSLEIESEKDKEKIFRLTSALIHMRSTLREEEYKTQKTVERLQQENFSLSITLENLMSNQKKLLTSLRHQEDDHTRELLQEIKDLKAQIKCKDAIIVSLKQCSEQLRQSFVRSKWKDKEPSW